MAELYGVFGNGMTPEHLRYIIDYVMVHGINLLVYGSYPQRNAKNWTSGCRPHFGPDDPMWKYFDEFHAYSGRASYLLSCGTALRTTAVVFDDRAVWSDNYENAAFMFWHDLTIKRLRERRILFDYIDDDMISSGRVEGTEFVAGAMRYKELVIPEIRKLSAAAEEKISSFIAAGGKVTSSGDEPESMIKVFPDYPDLWVEARQLDDKRRIWFFFNSGSVSIQPQIFLPDSESVVLADPLTGEFYNVKTSEDGSLTYRFGRYDTAFFITGMTAEKDLPETPEFENIRILSKNWTIQPLVRHFVGDDKLDRCECGKEILPAFTGDWRKLLGEDFSGDARYTVEFDWSGDIPQIIRLDLGKVNYCCKVILNNEELGKKFRGPFVFDVSGKIKPGINQLEVIVSNTLANAYYPREVELKLQEKWQRSGYENRQRSFELDSLESGLIGPVMLKF